MARLEVALNQRGKDGVEVAAEAGSRGDLHQRKGDTGDDVLVSIARVKYVALLSGGLIVITIVAGRFFLSLTGGVILTEQMIVGLERDLDPQVELGVEVGISGEAG